MAVLLDQIAGVDPLTLSKSQLALGRSIEEWVHRANTFTTGPGFRPGRGCVLVRLADLSLLDPYDHDLVFSGEDADHVVTLSPITVLSSECISPGSSADPDATYLVEVVDRRHLLGLVPIDKAYNLSSADGSAFLPQTKNGSSNWTWQTLVTDICTVIGVPALTLPFTPDGAPENLIYWGHHSALECLDDVLTRLACALTYDATIDTFGIARLGQAGDAPLAAITAGRTWDGYSAEYVRGFYPEYVRVRFPRRPVDAASGYSPYYVQDVALPGATGVQPGTYVTVDDDLSALGSSGAPSNLANLTTRAAERASDWLRKRQFYDRPVLRAWRDFLPEASGLGGNAVHKLVFDDRALMQTWGKAYPDRALEKWRPLGGWPVWYPLAASGGGSISSSDAALSSTYTLTGAPSWQDTGLSISLPTAGTYNLFGRASGQLAANTSTSPSNSAQLLVRLYDTAAAAVVPNTVALLVNIFGGTGGPSNVGTVASIALGYAIAASTTIKLQTYVGDASAIVHFAAGYTEIYNIATLGDTALGYIQTA